ncbi:MAG: undecaprenyl-diphosphate phosphatase [Candidatus Caenarcaniphilales bacterium]|nr:undecaprenyl-diphosphate phosphatase [Candidatus Caenarcaniphilales bacterium]
MINFQEYLRAIVLGIVQGLTEFLPISSSFHLRVVPTLLGWQEPGLAFSVFLHLGTLVAIFIYFGKDLFELGVEGFQVLLHNPQSLFDTLAGKIALATIPAIWIGFFLHGQLARIDQNFHLTAACLIGFSVLLWIADLATVKIPSCNDLSLWQTMQIGIGQAMALIPGVSRSGATITVGRFLGLGHDQAARFSFLLGAPVILGAGLLELVKFMRKPSELEISLGACLAGCIVAGIVGFFAIDLLIKFMQARTLLPFVIYRIVFGIIILFMLQRGVI